MNQTNNNHTLCSHLFGLLILILATAPATNALAASRQAPFTAVIQAKYQKACRGAIPKQSGLCLLTSRKPKADTAWLIATKDQSMADKRILDKEITPNVFLSLAPGEYLLYSKDGFDNGGNELSFTIEAGTVKTIRTSAYKASRKGLVIRHFKPSTGIAGAACITRTLDTTLSDVLPGNYLMYKALPNLSSSTCPAVGVASNALAGQAQKIRYRKYVNQKIPDSNRYRHSDGISSLTTISQFRDDIQEVAILQNWLSYNGITNPYPTRHSALVLSGVGTRTYIIPMKMNRRRIGCGRSLEKAGLSSMPILTECKFSGGKLREFVVKAGGSYFTLNNRHGAATIEGNNLNNSITVKGLSIAIK